MHHPIFTIGHSSHSWETFCPLIENPDIGCVIDIRSAPHLGRLDFRKSELRYRLNQIGISYIWLGNELGGYLDGIPIDCWAKTETKPFANGTSNILAIAARCRPVLLYAECEPLECHCCLFLSRHLVERRGAIVAHILRDGFIEMHQETECRLLSMYRGCGELFRTREQQLTVAYRLQAHKLGVGR